MINALVLIATYLIAVLAAGHGVMPVGLVLVAASLELGDIDKMPVWIAVISGWTGIATLVLSAILFRRSPINHSVSQIAFSFILYISWIAFAYLAAVSGSDVSFLGDLGFHFLLSLPFQLAFVFITVRLVLKIRAERTSNRVAL